MDSGRGIHGEGRAEEVVGLELADGSPEAGEEVGGQDAAGFLEGLAVGLSKQFKFIMADLGAGLLFRQPDPCGFVAGSEMVSGSSIRAHQDPGAEVGSGRSAEQFEGSGGDELKIIKVGVDAKDAHAGEDAWDGHGSQQSVRSA